MMTDQPSSATVGDVIGHAPAGDSGASFADAAAVAHACLEAVLRVRVDDGAQAAWPAATLAARDVPARYAVDDISLYNGDAGVVWALAHLGRALGRPELVTVAERGAQRVIANLAALPGEGLLDGRAGARLAAYACGRELGESTRLPDAADLTSGAAGVLLGQVRCGAAPDGALVRALARAARAQEVGWAWADPDGSEREGATPVPLCGLAHGASGVALALVEAAAVDPSLRSALALAVGGLAWESAWFDPVHGWPDLRSEPADYPVWWCHGAAGVTAVRVRLLHLAESGVDLGMPVAALRAQAHAGVELCRERVRTAAAEAQEGMPPHAGLSLCHGLGGPLDVLALAAEVTGSGELREEAAAALAAVATALGPDPLAWPCGANAPGSVSLFLGAAGVALVAARLAWPGHGIPSPSLLG